MVHNIFEQVNWEEFVINKFYIGKYKYYTTKQILLLDGKNMESSSDFVSHMLARLRMEDITNVYDYLGRLIVDSKVKYNHDQINDYLREIDDYMSKCNISNLVIFISNSSSLLCEEFEQSEVTKLLAGVVFENEVFSRSVDIICFPQEVDNTMCEEILEITSGAPEKLRLLDYYHSKPKDKKLIELWSIVVVDTVKFVIVDYCNEADLYTIRECLNYKNKRNVKYQQIDSIIR